MVFSTMHPNIHRANMLKNRCWNPPCMNMYVTSCHTWKSGASMKCSPMMSLRSTYRCTASPAAYASTLMMSRFFVRVGMLRMMCGL